MHTKAPGQARESFWSIAAAIMTVSSVGFGISLALPLLSLTLESRGVSAQMNGINTAMAGVASILVTPYISSWSQRLGTARLLIAAILATALSLPLFFVFESLTAWFVIRLIYHGAITIVFVLTEFWINTLASEKRRGMIIGVYATVLSIGFAGGPVVLAITGPTGFLPFLLGGAILALSAIPAIIARHSAPRIEARKSSRLSSYVVAVPTAMIAVFIFGAVEFGGMALIPVYGLRIGFEPEFAALLVGALAVGNVVSQIPLGWLSDRMDRRVLLLVCSSIGLVGSIAILALSGDTVALFVVIMIWGAIVAGLYTVGLAHLGSRFTGRQLAEANSAFVLMYSLGALVGPAFIGTAMRLQDPHGFTYALITLFALNTAFVLYRVLTVVKGASNP